MYKKEKKERKDDRKKYKVSKEQTQKKKRRKRKRNYTRTQSPTVTKSGEEALTVLKIENNTHCNWCPVLVKITITLITDLPCILRLFQFLWSVENLFGAGGLEDKRKQECRSSECRRLLGRLVIVIVLCYVINSVVQ